MLITTDITTLKLVAKNLGQSLKNDYDTKLSHASTLNLSARAFGYENYNTAKALLETNHIPSDELYEPSFHLMRSVGILENEAKDIITWYKKYVDYGEEDMLQVLREISEYATTIELSMIHEVYLSLWSMVIEDAFYFMTKSGQDVHNYSMGNERTDKVALELKQGDVTGAEQAASYQMSVEELKTSVYMAKSTGKNLRNTASCSLVAPLKDDTIKRIVQTEGIGSTSIKDLENILGAKDIESELNKLCNTTIDILINNKEKITEKAIRQFGKMDDSIYHIEIPTMLEKCFNK